MKLLIIAIFFSLPAMAQDDPPKYDTVKCWVVVPQWNKDSTASLMLSKAWIVRMYPFDGYTWKTEDRIEKLWSRFGHPVEYLAPNKRDNIETIKGIPPIMREWK